MNEIVLFIAVIAVLVISQLLLHRLRRPIIHHVRIIIGILLLVLVWFVNTEGSKTVKVVLGAVVLTSMIREIGLFSKPDAKHKS